MTNVNCKRLFSEWLCTNISSVWSINFTVYPFFFQLLSCNKRMTLKKQDMLTLLGHLCQSQFFEEGYIASALFFVCADFFKDWSDLNKGNNKITEN